jgi:hypothetical protein
VDVNGWACDYYKGIFDKALYEEVWVANWKTVGLEPSDFSVLDGMAGFFKGFAGDLMPLADKKVEGGGTINGLPIKLVLFEDGNKFMKKEVKEIRKEDFDPSLFELPEGLEEAEAE